MLCVQLHIGSKLRPLCTQRSAVRPLLVRPKLRPLCTQCSAICSALPRCHARCLEGVVRATRAITPQGFDVCWVPPGPIVLSVAPHKSQPCCRCAALSVVRRPWAFYVCPYLLVASLPVLPTAPGHRFLVSCDRVQSIHATYDLVRYATASGMRRRRDLPCHDAAFAWPRTVCAGLALTRALLSLLQL